MQTNNNFFFKFLFLEDLVKVLVLSWEVQEAQLVT